jgi:hypothetical protein
MQPNLGDIGLDLWNLASRDSRQIFRLDRRLSASLICIASLAPDTVWSRIDGRVDFRASHPISSLPGALARRAPEPRLF